MGDTKDQDERALGELAKRMLSTPPKRQEEMKIGKPRTKAEAKANPKQKEKFAPNEKRVRPKG
jgi:hypothetical protein